MRCFRAARKLVPWLEIVYRLSSSKCFEDPSTTTAVKWNAMNERSPLESLSTPAGVRQPILGSQRIQTLPRELVYSPRSLQSTDAAELEGTDVDGSALVTLCPVPPFNRYEGIKLLTFFGRNASKVHARN